MKFTHEWIEKNPWLLITLVVLVVSIGGIAEIVPLYFQTSPTEPVAGLKPYSPLRLYDRTFQWGSKRTGPDLARVGGRYSDEWHRTHLNNPRDVVPESNMPGYPWLATTKLDPDSVVPKMRALKRLGDPYTDEEIASAPKELEVKTEEDALIAYQQGMGTLIKAR